MLGPAVWGSWQKFMTMFDQIAGNFEPVVVENPFVLVNISNQEVGTEVHRLYVESGHDDLFVGQGWFRLLRQLEINTNVRSGRHMEDIIEHFYGRPAMLFLEYILEKYSLE